MVADEMACIVPSGKQATAFGAIHAHPAYEESRLEISPAERSKNSFICLLPTHLRAYVNVRIVHRNRDMGKLRFARVRGFLQRGGGAKLWVAQHPDRGDSYRCSLQKVQESSPVHPVSMRGPYEERNHTRDFISFLMRRAPEAT